MTPLNQATKALSLPAAMIKNGSAVFLADVPQLEPDAFRGQCLRAFEDGARLSALLVLQGEEGPELLAVLSHDASGEIGLMRGLVHGKSFPSLTVEAPQAQAFEREVFEQHGLEPVGHPWLKPLRRRAELDPSAPVHPYFQVEGTAVHEVAVGPVHAGVIEPGHFRFQCRGEEVYSLEIHLGFQHRGAEELLRTAAPARRLAVAETLAGETSIGHATAYCMALEALAGATVSPRAAAIRAIALELERLANHIGDLGALCGDVGYLPGNAYFGRLRGEFLNLTLELCGNRFGRGLLTPGGVRFDLESRQVAPFLSRLDKAREHVDDTARMTFETPSVISRFEGTGTLTRETADRLGLVGPAARACGCDRDPRRDHAWGAYRGSQLRVMTAETGDVLARAQLRWREAQESVALIEALSGGLPPGELAPALPKLQPGSVAVALTEGWRGEVVHVAVTGADGALSAYKVVDPSFHNWFGLAMALRDNQISDFPLCNKSFNLSYCGHDL